MKDFMKYTAATICGIIILSVIAGIMFMISLAGLMASDSAGKKAEKNSVFVLKLNGNVSERAEEGSPMGMLLGQADMENMGLDDILSAIAKAKDEKNIQGIYIEGGTTMFDSPATAQQIRDALKDFRKSGKWIFAYADQYEQSSYYIASVADSIFLNKTGMIDFKGLGGKGYYLTGLLEKVGVKYQCTRVGKYKSAVEQMTQKQMSDNDREQREAYIGSIWKHMLSDMAESRGVTAEQLNQLADDSIMTFAKVDDYVAAHLIDGYMYPDEMKALVKQKLGIDKDKDIKQMTLADVKAMPSKKKEKGDKIAVYYAYGEIIDEISSGFMSEHSIVGGTVVDDLNKLADDEKVRAVVLRVNSPGGSAVASEQIWHALKQLKEKKPLVVSMGGLAASGGYMISAPANYIVAEPTTITGSIGIFGLIPNASQLVTDKLGVTWDGVTTNKHGDYETNLVFAKENSDEIKYLQSYVDRGYDTFLSIVADGRGMTKEQVHEIAQGRVWVATDALPIKLVDQIGSLDDAVKKAVELAGISGDYFTAPYPEKTDWLSSLMASSEGDNGSYLDGQLREILGDLYEPYLELRRDQQRNRLQVRLPFSTTIK
ncbi:MAG: signal peptide peptidase SppA [Prevotella sp.]|nr:signal peptide peptidase SppA [Prevotella sp.]